MHLNSGYRDEGLELCRRLARVFAGAEAIVTPSASCAGHLREHAPELPVHELSQFLTGVLGIEDVGARMDGRIAYHPTCHSLRAMAVGDAPLRLLSAVRGLELVEIEQADQCCGFGGTFAVKNADVSTAMLDDKLAAIERSGASAVTALDNSCLMQIGGGLRGRGWPIRRCTWPRSWRPASSARRGRLAFPRPPDRARQRPAARNLAHATHTIREKRAAVVGELPEWQQLREAGAAIKRDVLANLDRYLVEFERAATGPAPPCTGRATPPRRTTSSPASWTATAPARWSR